MPLVCLRGSKGKLVLSMLLVCAVIFELGKYLYSLNEQLCQHVL